MIATLFRLLALTAALMAPAWLHAADVRVGLGTYSTHLRGEVANPPPAATYRTARLRGPAPTTQWYSSILFTKWSSPLYAHPVAYQALEHGFEISQPRKVPRFNPVREETDIGYPHEPTLTIKPLGFVMKDARIDKVSDWAVDVLMGNGKDGLTATVAHGDPFSYYDLTRGDVQILPRAAAEVFYKSDDGQVIGIKVGEELYAAYAARGARWDIAPDKFVLRFVDGARYFSIAALPNAEARTIEDLRRFAYAFISDTRVSWEYDESTSQVTTTFAVTTRVREGEDHGKIFALLPHQWHNNPVLGDTLPYEYRGIRGTLKTVAGRSFRTRYTYHGILPRWPRLSETAQVERLDKYLGWDANESVMASNTTGTYWNGKALGRAAQVAAILDSQGDSKGRDQILTYMKQRMESWFRYKKNAPGYFYYEPKIGTLIGYPDEYGTSKELNDHHFHYGYWIMAAAHVAMHDPSWASKQKWGGMIDLLIRDIASTVPADTMFPRLRHFDPYEGHSWASGIVEFWDGNNQESSSEAINAWAGMILWAEATGNKQLRDAAIYLYTTETNAVNYYWFDIYGLVFAPEYQNVEVSIVWGGKYEHRTWWTNEPRQVHGINMLPITGASLYLGRSPEFVKRNIEAADREFKLYLEFDKKAKPDMWQDILLSYYALYDAPAALEQWRDDGGLESGETRAHTYYWLQNLVNMGRPDFEVTADTPLYSVLRKGDRRTYLAYNAGAKTRTVTFSDGTVLSVPPRALASSEAPVKK